MAEIKTTNNANAKKVTVRLPRLGGKNAVQEEFFSVNGKNYIIKRGETVEIPPEVEEVIRNGEKAEDYALSYTDKLRDSVSAKDAELGIKK